VAAEDVGGLPGAAYAGGDADGGVAVGPHDAAGDVEDLPDVDLPHGARGVDAGEVADLSPVFVADSGEVALFEQCLAYRRLRFGLDASLCFAGVPLPEDVGPEVGDLLVVVVDAEDADESQ